MGLLLAATRLKPQGISPQIRERYDSLYQQWWNLQQQCDSSASPPQTTVQQTTTAAE
ncbi:hypothetical protein [Microcoleus sp. N9_A1]|uniref:hypothetical protein n=1 Tax=Microcoleus sp. N9_A1 TaxID=3055380 RepID=UPI002FD31691